jgi:hypothetical protein
LLEEYFSRTGNDQG